MLTKIRIIEQENVHDRIQSKSKAMHTYEIHEVLLLIFLISTYIDEGASIYAIWSTFKRVFGDSVLELCTFKRVFRVSVLFLFA